MGPEYNVVCTAICTSIVHSFPQSDSERASEGAEFQFLLKQMTERKKRKCLQKISMPHTSCTVGMCVAARMCVVAGQRPASIGCVRSLQSFVNMYQECTIVKLYTSTYIYTRPQLAVSQCVGIFNFGFHTTVSIWVARQAGLLLCMAIWKWHAEHHSMQKGALFREVYLFCAYYDVYFREVFI